MRLTRLSVAKLALPPGKPELIVFDDELPGFGIRLRAGGKRVWIVQYRLGAKQRRVTFGSVGTLDPEQARKQAKTLLAKTHLGVDPQGEKSEARARAVITLHAIAKRYLDLYALPRLKARSFLEVKRHIVSHWAPLHRLGIHQIRRTDVATRLSEIAAANGPIAANRARAALSALFTWAMREGIADGNPVVGTNRAAPERSRDRVLSDNEVAMIWHACAPDDYGWIVRLLILTGQRREEVGGMRWDELDFDSALWRIPSARTKNRLSHDVPLSSQTLEVLKTVPMRDRPFVFGYGDGPFQGWSRAKTALDERIAANGAKPQSWRIHDIRRTVSTRMAEIGILPHVIEAVLNHVSGHKAGVAGVYNRALYAAEKRVALVRWAEHVRSIVEDGEQRVIPLRVSEGSV